MNIVHQADEMVEALRKGWARGALALDEVGRAVPPTDPTASRFCVAGAVAYAKAAAPRDVTLSGLIAGELGDQDWMVWNDSPTRTYEEVLRLAQRVREEAEMLASLDSAGRELVAAGN